MDSEFWTDYWILVIFWSIVWGLAAMVIRQKKSESAADAIAGFLTGFILGPIGVLVEVAWKGNRTKCQFCKQLIDPKASVCPHCQRDIRSDRQAAGGKPTAVDADELLKLKSGGSRSTVGTTS